MQSLKYRITTLSPVLMSRTSGDQNTVSTSDFISGTTLQGVFAGLFFKKSIDVNAFYNLFFEGSLNFLNAYISNKGNRFYPLPLSVQEEKNGNDVYDLLYFENENDIQTLTKNSRNDKFSLLYGSSFKMMELGKSLNFHHERDDEKGISKEGIIFNYESINSNQVLEGYIIGSYEEIKEIRKLLPEDKILFIGRSKNSQYGKVKFEFVEGNQDESVNKLELNNGTISLTFLSNVILYNEYGNSSCNIEILEKLFSDKFSEVKIIKSFIKTGIIENYVSVWKLKKPAEVCFLAGSSFLLSGLKDSDLTDLKKIQEKGIGFRKNEGFGRIAFGIQKQEKLTDVPISKSKPAVPKIPDLTKAILTKSIDDFITKVVRTKAFSDEAKFSVVKSNNKITKSLVSRMEAFIESSNNHKEFIGKLKDLKDDASSKLKESSFDKISFYDYLEKPFEIEKIINTTENGKLDEAIQLINYNPKTNYDKFNQEYFLTFFQALRKTLKTKGV